MPNSPQTLEFVEDQLGGLDIRIGKMFGEAALYCDTKVVGFICDDTLFLKITEIEIEGTEPGHPYPGSKPYHAVHGDLLENREWLMDVVQATADVLPLPKPKK